MYKIKIRRKKKSKNLQKPIAHGYSSMKQEIGQNIKYILYTKRIELQNISQDWKDLGFYEIEHENQLAAIYFKVKAKTVVDSLFQVFHVLLADHTRWVCGSSEVSVSREVQDSSWAS